MHLWSDESRPNNFKEYSSISPNNFYTTLTMPEVIVALQNEVIPNEWNGVFSIRWSPCWLRMNTWTQCRPPTVSLSKHSQITTFPPPHFTDGGWHLSSFHELWVWALYCMWFAWLPLQTNLVELCCDYRILNVILWPKETSTKRCFCLIWC